MIAARIIATTLVIATTPILSETDKLWLARAVQGEVGVMGEHREETGRWVVHVALNRMGNKWFPDDMTRVIKWGFWGAHTIGEPDDWAREIVNTALSEREQGIDPTGGSLFILGGQDLVPCMDWVSHRGSLKREGWMFSTHLFTRWPFSETCKPR